MNNRPPDKLLEQFASLTIWRLAEREAMRSPHKRHKTGAVIFYGMGGKSTIYSSGTAHPHDGGRRSYSVHAETHAVSRLPPNHGGAVCLVVTLNKTGNYSTCSRPCENCANLLARHVWGTMYCEMTNTGTWVVRREPAENLLNGFLQKTKVNNE